MSRNKFKPRLEFKTKRLILRPYKTTDFKAWKTSYDKTLPPQTPFEFTVAEHLLTRQGFTKWVIERNKLAAKDVVYVFGIFAKSTGEHVGTIDLGIVRRVSIQCANLGYAIRNHLWGQGYAQEASKAALEIAFKNLKLHRVEAAIDRKNRASLNVAKKIGLVKEGTRKKFYYVGESWLDCEFYAMTCETAGFTKMQPTIYAKVTDYL